MNRTWQRCTLLIVLVLMNTPCWAADIGYEYDDVGRLTAVVYDDATRVSYTYDTSGNRLSHSVVLGTPPTPASIVVSVLPASRSVQVGAAASAFATVLNLGETAARGCRLAAPASVDAAFRYQTTDPATNRPTGTADTPADIPAGQFQSFFFSLTPRQPITPVDLRLHFDLLLSASTSAVADVIALVATPSADGIVNLSGPSRAGAFSVATVNVGAAASVQVSAETRVALPLTLALCETNPTTGQCINPTTPTTGAVTKAYAANATPTFSVFASAASTVAFDPARHRVFLNVKDAAGAIRGSTSVAVRTQ